jgi:hypothetical protein
MHDCLDLGYIGYGQTGSIGKAGKELAGSLVYLAVGGLGGEDHRNKQLEGVPEVQEGPGIGIAGVEDAVDYIGPGA